MSENQTLLKDTSNKNKSTSYVKYIIIGIITLIVIAAVITVIVVFTNNDEESPLTTSWDDIFLSLPDTVTARNNSWYLTSKPHLAGSIENYDMAKYINDKFIDYGIQSEIRYYNNTEMTKFGSSSLILNGNITFDLREKAYDEDSTSDTEYNSQAFLGYAMPGNKTGPLIYINYGSRDDYLELNRMGINMTGCIGLVRYGGGMFRGTKVMLAEEYGLIGLIIYSDPKDYVYEGVDLFPNGSSLPETGFQRGSVISIDKCPGNPSAERVAKVCNVTQDDLFPGIPAIPLSYGNAEILFNSMTNPDDYTLPDGWQGGIDIDYNIGGNSDTIVNIFVDNEIQNFTLSNTVGFIPGWKYPNESIMIGNHRDAWVFGAADPISGSVTMMEIAKAFGIMFEEGWRPLRNIYFASWDGEEHNLIGSTDFAEEWFDVWKSTLVAYLNVDTSISGPNPYVQASPILAPWVVDRLKYVELPYEEELTIYDRWLELKESNTDPNRTINPGPMGSGSDYTAYLDHIGISSFNGGFSSQYGTYHSVYDSFYWMSLVDPEYKRTVNWAKYLGLLALDLLQNDKYPFYVPNMYTELYEWLTFDIEALQEKWECVVPAELTNALLEELDSFKYIADDFQAKFDAIDPQNTEEVTRYNEAMRLIPQKLIYEAGLPTRPFFKNLMEAPDIESGYSPQVLPMLAYAIKYECNLDSLTNAYDITTLGIKNVTTFLETYLY